MYAPTYALYPVHGDAGPYTFMLMPGIATSCTQGNDYAPALNLLD